MRRKLRRLASSSRNARATVQGSDGRLPVILQVTSAPPVACRLRAARCVRALPRAERAARVCVLAFRVLAFRVTSPYIADAPPQADDRRWVPPAPRTHFLICYINYKNGHQPYSDFLLHPSAGAIRSDHVIPDTTVTDIATPH